MDDWVGKAGVEQAFESYLKGTDGVRTIFTNADGKVTSEIYSTDPQPGNTVALTIDIDFQQSVEEALAVEAADSQAAQAYVNVLAVKEGRESDPAIQALAKALCSDEVKAFIDETYAGAVQAVF